MLERLKVWLKNLVAPPPPHERTEEERQQELREAWGHLEEASARVQALQETVGVIIREGVVEL